MTALPEFVTGYWQLMDRYPGHFGEKQWQLRELIRKTFESEDLTAYQDRLDSIVDTIAIDIMGFKIVPPFQRMIFGLLLCVYTKSGLPRFSEVFCVMGRGNGKTGMSSVIGGYGISGMNPVRKYNVNVFANNYDQAATAVKDFAAEVKANKELNKKVFRPTLEIVTGLTNQSEFKAYANNPKGHDGLRPGLNIFDEIHEFQDFKEINVCKSGMGKVKDMRTLYITTNGYTNDGPFDHYYKRAQDILSGKAPLKRFLPIIFEIDGLDEINDPECWHKANPMLMYSPTLQEAISDQYEDWSADPANFPDFPTKRMNIRVQRETHPVATTEQIKATEKPLPDLAGMHCTIGIDFAKSTDMIGVNLHFKDGDKRYDICHAWMCKQSRDFKRIKPLEDFEALGLVTIVDDVEIHPSLIGDYIRQAMSKYKVVCVSIDNFRYGLMKPMLDGLGFSMARKNLYMVRPSDMMKVAPIVVSAFANQWIHWGDNRMLRWACNNTALEPRTKKNGGSEDMDVGNFIFAKIEPKARKTDPFMAVVHSMVVEDKLPKKLTKNMAANIGLFF